jgi:hypothetical protein
VKSMYKREQALKAQGMNVRRANHAEQTVNEYGDKLTWVVDLGGQRQARQAYRTKAEALAAAEHYVA